MQQQGMQADGGGLQMEPLPAPTEGKRAITFLGEKARLLKPDYTQTLLEQSVSSCVSFLCDSSVQACADRDRRDGLGTGKSIRYAARDRVSVCGTFGPGLLGRHSPNASQHDKQDPYVTIAVAGIVGDQ